MSPDTKLKLSECDRANEGNPLMFCRTWNTGKEANKSQAHEPAVLQDIYTSIQRSAVLVSMGTAFQGLLAELLDEATRTMTGIVTERVL